MTATIVEGFIVDQAFVDQSKSINGILIDDSASVATLTPKALSYFNTPSVFSDTRNPSSRTVNWAAVTSPKLVVDETSFGDFVSTINNLGTPVTTGVFKIIDKLGFNYTPSTPLSAIETFLTTDPDTVDLYVENSFQIASALSSDTVYLPGNTHSTITTPTFIKFSIVVLSGSAIRQYDLTLFLSVSAWLTGYNESTIVTVVPPLPYDEIYNSSLTLTTDNIFATATMTANLSYSTTQALLGSISVSGYLSYNVVVVDSGLHQRTIPFNILYKGRFPTQLEIRTAIRNELLNSGIGNEAGWKLRIPGIFILGRFYVIPFWGETYTKPDQILYPNILSYTKYSDVTNAILESLGWGNVDDKIDILPVYYNKMTTTAVPDLSGSLPITHLSALIPDYQSYSPSDDNFSYMNGNTELFSNNVNTILSIDNTGVSNPSYHIYTENLLSFYVFIVGEYEICVITKLCYETIMESVQ